MNSTMFLATLLWSKQPLPAPYRRVLPRQPPGPDSMVFPWASQKGPMLRIHEDYVSKDRLGYIHTLYMYVCIIMYVCTYIYIIFCVWLFEGFMLGLPDPFWGLGAQFGRIFLTISLSKILTQEHLVSGHILGKWTSKPQIFTHLVMARLKVFVGPNFSCQFRHKANQCKGKHAIMSWFCHLFPHVTIRLWKV